MPHFLFPFCALASFLLCFFPYTRISFGFGDFSKEVLGHPKPIASRAGYAGLPFRHFDDPAAKLNDFPLHIMILVSHAFFLLTRRRFIAYWNEFQVREHDGTSIAGIRI